MSVLNVIKIILKSARVCVHTYTHSYIHTQMMKTPTSLKKTVVISGCWGYSNVMLCSFYDTISFPECLCIILKIRKKKLLKNGKF